MSKCGNKYSEFVNSKRQYAVRFKVNVTISFVSKNFRSFITAYPYPMLGYPFN